MTNFIRLREIIYKLFGPSVESEKILFFFNQASDEELLPIIKLIEDNSSWFHKINQNIKDKKLAFDKKDKKIWQKIISREEKELAKMKD